MIPVERDWFADNSIEGQARWLAAFHDRFLDRGRQERELRSGSDVRVRVCGPGGDLAQRLAAAQFVSPVFAGSPFDISGRVVALNEREGNVILRLQVHQQGRHAALGEAVAPMV